MANFHCPIKVKSKSGGKSVIAAVAYRAGERIVEESTGLIHNYTSKKGVHEGGIMAPEGSPEWVMDREKLWNSVDKIEKGVNAQFAREFEISIPNELNVEQQLEFIHEICKMLVNEGMIVDWNRHHKEIEGQPGVLDKNPHVHILATTRKLGDDGKWMPKSKKEYILKDGEKVRCKNSRYYESRKIMTVDWDNRDNAEKWRGQIADITNKHLKRAGIETRVDHRSYERQGIDKTPTLHLTPQDSAKEKKGIHTDRGDVNRFIIDMNNKKDELRKQLENLQKIKSEQLATPPTQQYSIVQMQNILKRRYNRLKKIYENAVNQKIQNTEHDMKLIRPYRKDAAIDHFTKIYSVDMQNNEADIQKNEAKLTKEKNSFFKSNSKIEELTTRKTMLSNEQKRLKENYKNDVALATKGNFEDRGIGTKNSNATQKIIHEKAEKIAFARDPEMGNKKDSFAKIGKELDKVIATVSREMGDCRKMLDSTKNVNSDKKIELPVLNKNTGENVGVLSMLGNLVSDGKNATLNAYTADDDDVDWEWLSPAEVEIKMKELADKQDAQGMNI